MKKRITIEKPLIKLIDLRHMQLQHSMGKICWTYFFWNEQTELYKIGKSNNPWRRCQELSSIMGARLTHLFSFQAPEMVEGLIHGILKPYRHSHEWFKTVPEVDQMMEEFEEFCLNSPVDNPVLTAEDVDYVIREWANSYGRGTSAKAVEMSNCGENR